MKKPWSCYVVNTQNSASVNKTAKYECVVKDWNLSFLNLFSVFIIYLSIIVHVGLKPLIRPSLPESLVLNFPVQLP